MELIHTFEGSAHPLLLGDVGHTFRKWQAHRAYSAYFLVLDTETERHCADLFFQKTGLSPQIPRVVVPAGERHKNVDTCQAIWAAMMEASLDRKALSIHLGGGVVGDMGGFCAATFKRGIDFLQIPTTLLAATDASVGGKLGIDFQGFKNMIGVFQHPAGVLVDPVFFHTLPRRELCSGFAEMLKHAAIGAPALWETIAPLQDLDRVDWMEALRLSIEVKAHVVAADPHERGIRAVLNFGHTIGHALESYFLHSDTPLLHGEAVAWGMYFELCLWEARGGKIAPHFPDAAGLKSYLLRFFEEPNWPAGLADALYPWLLQDKKNEGGAIRLSLPGQTPYSMHWMEVYPEHLYQIFTSGSRATSNFSSTD